MFARCKRNVFKTKTLGGVVVMFPWDGVVSRGCMVRDGRRPRSCIARRPSTRTVAACRRIREPLLELSGGRSTES